MDVANAIAAYAATFDFPLSAPQLRACAQYFELVRTWNAKTNLVGSIETETLLRILFRDAFLIAGAAADAAPAGARIVDVGSGAGAPVIPIAILRADVEFTLVEPRRRRVAFLRAAIGTIRISSRAFVIEGRVQDVELDPPYEVAWSRATFQPAEWLRVAKRLAPRALVFAGSRDALPPNDDGWTQQHVVAGVPGDPSPNVLALYRRPSTA